MKFTAQQIRSYQSDFLSAKKQFHHRCTQHSLFAVFQKSTMPKAPGKKNSKGQQQQQLKNTSSSKSDRTKNPKDSHLYTDDNPATTIHGTGFKDQAAAEQTLSLISKRSLTYQFQTVNTMWHRANHHPHKSVSMEKAMTIFREWLDITYPRAKEGLRIGGWKPLLSKECVGRYLNRILNHEAIDETAKTFAEKYVELPKGKRLANVLMNEKEPEEPDMERLRYDTLCDLVPEGKEKASAWTYKELWENEGTRVTDVHLRLISWAWSPIGDKKLP